MRQPLLVVSLLACVALSEASGCTGEPTEPYEVYAIAPDLQGRHGIRRVQLPVHDPRTLASDELAFEGRSGINIWLEGEGESLRILGDTQDGVPIHLDLVQEDGAYAAADHESLIALSSAHHLLAARRYFDDLGLARFDPPFPRQRVVLFPSSISLPLGLTGRGPTSDNAFFADAIGGFAILREVVLDSLPLATNQGVLTHEFAHAIFAHLTRHLPAAALGMPLATLLLPALNEGLADIHAAAMTADPAFVAASVPSEADNRDLAVRRVYIKARAVPDGTGNPYWYGSIVASTFWSYRSRLVGERGLAEPEARRRMGLVAFEGLRDMLAPTLPEIADKPFHTSDEVDAVLARVEVEFWRAAAASAQSRGDKDIFCAAVVDHLAERPLVYEGACP